MIFKHTATIYFLLVFTFLSIIRVESYITKRTVTIETIYGSMNIDDEAVIDILNSTAMLRLKRIHQYGIWGVLNEDTSYTRYDHSLGVYYLLIKYGATREECIFGLLHDISHTVFSHVADYIAKTITKKKSYQDDILPWYIDQTDLKDILEKHNLLSIITDESQTTFTMLKNSLPSLCIDRLEYNLYGGLIDNILSKNDIIDIVNTLIYENDRFVFTDIANAKKFSLTSIELSINNWCNPTNCFVYQETANMILYALDKNIISKNDFHFSDDETVWHTLENTNDNQIQSYIKHLKTHCKLFSLGSENDYDLAITTKFRGVDPFVMTENGEIRRLSEIDNAFAEYFNYAKQHCAKPIFIKTYLFK